MRLGSRSSLLGLAPGLVLLLLLSGRQPAAGQCLPLARLLQLGQEGSAAAASGRTAGKPLLTLRHLLPDTAWTYQGPMPGTRDLHWTSYDPQAAAGQPPAALLSLRPSQPTRDVVLKTTSTGCVRQLRQQLERQRLLPEPVTCPDCEGVRYQAPAYTVTIYSRKKGDYPFVVVVRQPPAAAAAAAGGSRRLVVEAP